MTSDTLHRDPAPDRWVALVFLAAAYFLFDPLESAIARPVAQALDLHMRVDGTMALLPYGWLMVVRLGLDALIVAGVYVILGYRLRSFPLAGDASLCKSLLGLLTGLAVMTAAILTIVACGDATLKVSSQSGMAALLHGAGWLCFDFIGAAGEELFGRVAILLVAQQLIGMRGAVVVSALTFSLIHLGNPGASAIWLLRLAMQGALLAWAVYRTRSVWWSVGYHTGWNWASAPLFGAAGSGYLDEGHLFEFFPGGSEWINGGSVGPEGSVFAFVAVLVAFGILLATTRPRWRWRSSRNRKLSLRAT